MADSCSWLGAVPDLDNFGGEPLVIALQNFFFTFSLELMPEGEKL